MIPGDPMAELDVLVRSRYGIVVLDTPDESQADSIIRGVATRLSLPLWFWSRHAGLTKNGDTVADTALPLAARHDAPGWGPWLTGSSSRRPTCGSRSGAARQPRRAPSC